MFKSSQLYANAQSIFLMNSLTESFQGNKLSDLMPILFVNFPPAFFEDVKQSDWLKIFEYDVVIGHYWPEKPAHYIKNSKILGLNAAPNGFVVMASNTNFVIIDGQENAMPIE